MFTGALSIVRREAQAVVTELGGLPGSSVNKRTDYLVVGDDYGSKFTTAQILGVKCIDEDEFWAMVSLAREESGLEILLSKEELKDFDSISEEKWKYVFSKNPNLLILTEEGLLDLLKVEEKEEVPTKLYPPAESMTYYSKENLEKWVQSGNVQPKLGSRVCPYCNYEIPYSTDSYYWYCFKCRLYSSMDQVIGRHVCVDWERLDIDTENGFYVKCKLCNNVKAVVYAEVDSNVKSCLKCDFVHSLEFEAEFVEIDAEFDRRTKESAEQEQQNSEILQASFSSERKEELYSQFQGREEGKEARHRKKVIRRDTRLAEKRAAHQPN